VSGKAIVTEVLQVIMKAVGTNISSAHVPVFRLNSFRRQLDILVAHS